MDFAAHFEWIFVFPALRLIPGVNSAASQERIWGVWF